MGQTERDRFETDPAGRSPPNLTMRIVAGLRWSYLGNMSLMAAHLVYIAAISRLLDPAAFGLMALANLVVLFTSRSQSCRRRTSGRPQPLGSPSARRASP
jgi:hypothetical protein